MQNWYFLKKYHYQITMLKIQFYSCRVVNNFKIKLFCSGLNFLLLVTIFPNQNFNKVQFFRSCLIRFRFHYLSQVYSKVSIQRRLLIGFNNFNSNVSFKCSESLLSQLKIIPNSNQNVFCKGSHQQFALRMTLILTL